MKRISFVWLSPTLTKVGKRFGIDAHYFAKNSFLVLVGQGIGIIRGIIAGYFVARFFSQQTYGEYQFILSVSSMLGSFTLPGLAQSVTRAWAKDYSFSRRKLVLHQLTACAIGSLILLGIIPFLGRYGRAELWPLFVVAAILFPLPPIGMVHFGGYTVGKAKFDLSLRATITWSILTILATLFIIFFYQSAALMLFASTAIPPLVYLYYSRKLHPPPAKNGEDKTKDIIRYGWHLSFATLPVELVWYLDKLLISHFFGLNQLATFSVALMIPEQAKQFFKPLLPIGFSRQARGGDSMDRRKKLMKVGLVGTGIFAIGIAFYIALCPILIPFLFPQYPANEVILLTSVAAITLLAVPAGPFAQYLEAQGMIRYVRLSNWIAAALFAVALMTLIPLYGLLGAILARGVFRIAHMCVLWWFVTRSPIQVTAAA